MTEAVPGIAYLDAKRVIRGLRAGIHRVMADQERLNRINVFPVPDGDTGTNLAMTMQSILSALARSDDQHAGRVLELVADAALDGAKGNSGAILAQFFHGLGDACGQLRTLTTDPFVDAVRQGARYAREALSEPREGTILTVLAEFAAAINVSRKNGQDFVTLLDAGLRRAVQALAETTNQLDVLRRAGVVDAGAQGFVDLLQGICALVHEGSLEDVPESPLAVAAEARIDHGLQQSTCEHRFCTECTLTGESIDRRALREQLSSLGSSLVLAGTARKIRVHMHVDDPEALFVITRRFGTICGQKADDMSLQQRAARGDRPAVAVVMDTAGDIAESDMERYGIFVVPIHIHFGDKSFLDKVTLTPEQFYAELQSNPHHPKTSQPPPGDFRRLYQFLGSHHQAVVSVHVSAKVSGTLQAAESAANRSSDSGPVVAIDSRNASLGQGMIALYAAEMAEAGFDLDQIVIRMEKVISRTRTFGLLQDMRYAVRGGRVPRYRKVIADMFRLNPVLTNFPDGRIAAGGFIFGRHRSVERFARFIAARTDVGKTYRIGVGHADNPDEADRLLQILGDSLPSVSSHFTTEVGTALGAHGGPGTLVVALQEDIPIGAPER